MGIDETCDLPASSPGDRSGGELGRLVCEYMDRLIEGQELDPEEILTRHPQLGPAVLKELRTFTDLDEGRGGALLARTRTIGDYQLRRRVGRGGMGVVYEAWQMSMERRVALKVLPAGLAADTRTLTRFVREAKVAGGLQHPNVVSVYGLGVESDAPYYAMEFVEGETLSQLLDRLHAGRPAEAPGPLDSKDADARYCFNAAEAFAGAAEGLYHAHQKGVTHRDLKPSNLILDRSGRLRILDFGLARLEGQESLTQSGDLMGTILYMSPEQAMAKRIPVDHRTDIYSLGATLYEVLTRRPPFEGKTSQETLSSIIVRDPPLLRARNPLVPGNLETIVLKCLRKDPGERYATAEALAQDLRRFVRGDAIEARPESPWERFARRAWRQRKVIAVGLLLTVAAGLIVGQLLSLRRENQRKLEGQYETLVRQAALRLELAPVTQKGNVGDTGLSMPLEDTSLLTPSSVDPAAFALDDLEKAIALFPQRPDAQYYRSRALLYLGRVPEARDALDRLASQAKPFLPALTLRAYLLDRSGDRATGAAALAAAELAAGAPWERAWIAVSKGWRDGDYVLAVEAYGKLLDTLGEREPFLGSTLTARMGRGLAWKELKSYAYALSDFAVAGSLATGALEPAILEAEAMHLLGRKGEAERALAGVFDSTSRRDEAAMIIANVYDSLGEAEKQFEWLGKITNPSLREALRGWALYELGQFKEAKAIARNAIEVNPANAEAYDLLAYIYNKNEGRNDLAVRALEEALKHHKPSCPILRLLAVNLNLVGRHAEAIQRAEEAAALAVNPGSSYVLIALSQYYLGNEAKGDEWARRAQEADPQNVLVEGNLAGALERLGRQEEAYETFSRFKDNTWCATGMGSQRFLQGRYDEALEIYHRSETLKPFQSQSFQFAALCHELKGRPTEAVEELVKLLDTTPSDKGAHGILSKILCARPGGVARKTLERCALVLEKGRVAGDRSPRLLNSLALVHAALPGGESWGKAAQAALDGLESGETSGEFVEELCLTLRSILSARGPQGSCAFSLLSRLPTYAGIDALFEAGGEALVTGCEESTMSQDATLDDTQTSHRRAYLRARLLAARGKSGEAEALARALVSQETDLPEPRLLLVKVLRAEAKVEEAERALRSAFESKPRRSSRLWYAWLDVSFRDLNLAPGQVLRRFPRVPAAEAPPMKEGFLAALAAAETATEEVDAAQDVNWLLEELAAGRSLKIRCGGDTLALPDGQVWGKDRFFIGGHSYNAWAVDIRGTDIDDLYRRVRVFSNNHSVAEGYAIPVPPGRFRVHLHFAETFGNWPGNRRFDVVAQGKVVLKDFEILARVPFRTAHEEVFEVSVDEGPLDLRFRVGIQFLGPLVSAIEVERVE